ncbi:MAG: RNA polymerase sigma factor [Muribaculaceae bacterium]|nr:RNA polymerase sigma factor [Muribaculaceae bacterium]
MTRELFVAHVEGTQKALRRFLVALCCGDTQRADDLAQETFVKAYLSCDGFNSPEKFNAWIFRIAYNTFLNSQRSRRCHVAVDEAYSLEAAECADGAFRYQELYAALGQLSESERMSVLLYYMEEYSVKEISEVTGAGTDAVRQHLSRARRRLRGILAG